MDGNSYISDGLYKENKLLGRARRDVGVLVFFCVCAVRCGLFGDEGSLTNRTHTNTRSKC